MPSRAEGARDSILQMGSKSPCAGPTSRPRRASRVFHHPLYFSTFHHQKMATRRQFGTPVSGNRGVPGELTELQRTQIFRLYHLGESPSDLAVRFGCHRNTITNTIKRVQRLQNFKSTPRTGRPKLFTSSATRHVNLIVKRAPRIKWTELIAQSPIPASKNTIRKNLDPTLRRKYRPVKKIYLSKEGALLRFEWAKYWRKRRNILREVGLFASSLSAPG